MTELSRRDFLKAAGGGGKQAKVEQVKVLKLKKEQDPQKILLGMLDLSNRYIAKVINKSRLDRELNVTELIQFGGGEKTLQVARIQLDRPEINQAIDRSLPRDFGIMQID